MMVMYQYIPEKDAGGDDKLNYGFTTLWEPNDQFSLKFHYEIMEDKSEQGSYVNKIV